MDVGLLEAGAFGLAAAIALKSLDLAGAAIAVGRRKLNGRWGNSGQKRPDVMILDELKTLNELVAKAVMSLEKGSEIMDDTRERVKENQAGIDKMHRDVLLLRGGGT